MIQPKFNQPSRINLMASTAIAIAFPRAFTFMLMAQFQEPKAEKSGFRIEKGRGTKAGKAQLPKRRKAQGFNQTNNTVLTMDQEEAIPETELSVARGKKTTFEEAVADLALKATAKAFETAAAAAARDELNYPFPKKWQKGDAQSQSQTAAEKRAEANAARRALHGYKVAAGEPAGAERSYERSRSRAVQAFLDAPTWSDYERHTSSKSREAARAAKHVAWWDLPQDNPWAEEDDVLASMGFDGLFDDELIEARSDYWEVREEPTMVFNFAGYYQSLQQALMAFALSYGADVSLLCRVGLLPIEMQQQTISLQDGGVSHHTSYKVACFTKPTTAKQPFAYQGEGRSLEVAIREFAAQNGVSL